jgi:hypothetical protein
MKHLKWLLFLSFLALAGTAYAFNLSVLPLPSSGTVRPLPDLKPVLNETRSQPASSSLFRELEIQRYFATSA